MHFGNLPGAASVGWAAIFHEVEGFFLVTEAGLGLFCYGEQRGRVRLPVGDAAVIFAAVFVVDDEWVDAVAEAFFDHQDSAHAAVAVFEGVDLLEAGVVVEDVAEGDVLFVFVF